MNPEVLNLLESALQSCDEGLERVDHRPGWNPLVDGLRMTRCLTYARTDIGTALALLRAEQAKGMSERLSESPEEPSKNGA